MRSRLLLLSGPVMAVLVGILIAGCVSTAQVPDMSARETTAPITDDALTVPAPPVPLSSAEVYEAIEDSVVFVLAPDEQSSGSGIVIQDGWILTNAHVVDRHQTMRIGRSDGQDLGEFPVQAVDWVFDLALVGPVDDQQLQPIPAGTSADLRLGSRVLLAGFPDEDSIDPTPTLTEGIVSRRRFMALGEYPFLQVDATIAPGQSGGALVNDKGELVGISGLEFGQGEFGLVFAADPMWPRIDDMITLGSSQLPTGEPVSALQGEVGPLRSYGFTVEVEPGQGLEFSVASDADVWVDVQTLGGITVSQFEESEDPFRFQEVAADAQLYVDELIEGGEDVVADVDAGIYQVVVGSFADSVETVEVTSANALKAFADVEEDALLPLGRVVEGDFDWERDTDTWRLDLDAGDNVEIIADGIADTLVVVRLGDEVVASSDDEGLGLFGTGSRLEFTAEAEATYTVEIGTYDRVRWGYLIQASVTPAA